LLLLVSIGLVAACTSSGSATTTTTTVAGAATSTTEVVTSTTTAATADPGFRTRRRGVLTVATDRMVPPYVIERDGAAASGLEYDIAAAVAAHLHVAVEFVHAPLVTLATGYDCGCDLYLGQVPATELLARSTDLSEPYLSADQVVLLRAGVTIADKPTAQALRWGTQVRDDDGITWLHRTLVPTAPLDLYPDQTTLLDALHAGAVDAALVDAPVALVAVQSDPTVQIAGRIATGGAYAAVLPLGSANTSALNDIIRTLTRSGAIGLLARLFLGAEPQSIPVLDLSGS
jgi:polar amino acid transport system substrate-binding protein/glutamine transport system substrate-binding protein